MNYKYDYWLLLSPAFFMIWSNNIILFLKYISICLLSCGLVLSLFLSPSDSVQGETYRIVYIHVPCAWMALSLYTIAAGLSSFYFITRHPLYIELVVSLLKVGSIYTFLTLVTGSLWGLPMWGTFWAWDARMTSVLVLFFFYLGSLCLYYIIDDLVKRSLLVSITTIIGFINIPIIKYSVEWWFTLHQPSSITLTSNHIHLSMIVPLFIMFLFVNCHCIYLILKDMRAYIITQRLNKFMKLVL